MELSQILSDFALGGKSQIPIGSDLDALIQIANESWSEHITIQLLKLRDKLKKPDTPESKIQSQVVKYAKGKGMKVYRIFTQNAPDRLFFSKRGPFFIEFKRKGKKPTPSQDREHKELFTKYDQTVFVVDNIEYGKQVIDNFS